MTGPGYREEQILSGLALNFLDDLYYLKLVNHNFSDLIYFGKNKGIFFLKESVVIDFRLKNTIRLMKILSNPLIMNFIFQEIIRILLKKGRVAPVGD